MSQQYTYQDLLEIVTVLRSEKGCSWDRAQTHESLLPSLLEESYELTEAVNKRDVPNMKEEIGDVLLQVLMHAEIAKEEGTFTLEDVIDGIAQKLVYRHPHVFGEASNTLSESEVQKQWDELKKKEKKQQSTTDTMESVAKALPALVRADKIHRKAAKVGFTWEDTEGVIDKIEEECNEVKSAIKSAQKEAIEEEIGDLLFSVVGLASFLEINAEFTLTKTIEKFINRFRYIENSAFVEGKELLQMTLEEMDQLWNASKKVDSNI